MSKSSKNRDRRAVVERMRREARAAERKRTLVVVVISVTIALVIVGLAGYRVWKDNQAKSQLAQTALADIGTSASKAGCTPVRTKSVSVPAQHVATKVIYETVPPAYGPHSRTPAPSGTHFYSTSDRPPLESLVHNLEHGWTIVWYDESVAADAAKMQVLKATAAKFDAHGSDPRFNVIIAPWTASDGEGQAIPGGKHIAFTHWSIHQPVYSPPTGSKSPPGFGELQYCSSFSGATLTAYMKKFPYDDAPEGFLWHQ